MPVISAPPVGQRCCRHRRVGRTRAPADRPAGRRSLVVRERRSTAAAVWQVDSHDREGRLSGDFSGNSQGVRRAGRGTMHCAARGETSPGCPSASLPFGFESHQPPHPMLEVGTRAVPIFLPAAAASSAAFLPCMRTTSPSKVISLTSSCR